MKTKKAVISEHPEYKTLINAVISNIGMESVQDVINHGIGGGFGGFIYYSDTVAFFKKHKKEIMALAKEQAAELGENMLDMIAGFNCLNGSLPKGTEHYTTDEIGAAIWGDDGEYSDQIQNAMAWFAAEEVCRWFEE